MWVFVLLGKLITLCPPLFAMLMPIISTVFIIVGFSDYDIQDRVADLWIPEATQYAKREEYKKSLGKETLTSGVLAISYPRGGGNIITANNLLEIRDRLQKAQLTTVDVDGMTFSFDDVCYNPVGASMGAYTFPCLRMTVLDCFHEGDYDFTAVHAAAWRQMVIPSIYAAQVNDPSTMGPAMAQGMMMAVAQLYQPIVMMGLTQTPAAHGGCAQQCVPQSSWGLPTAVAAVLNQTAGTWESNTACVTCVSNVYNAIPNATKDAIYVSSMEGLLRIATGNVALSAAQLQQTYQTSTQKAAIIQFLTTTPAFKAKLEAAVRPEVLKQIQAGVVSLLNTKTPYDFMTYGTLVGHPRPFLKNPSTGKLATDSEVLKAVSGACYSWDGGAAMPANIATLLYGNPVPQVGEFDDIHPMTSMEALLHAYSLLIPAVKISGDSIVERVKHPNRPSSQGGPVQISVEQAKRVLKEFKASFENALNSGWNSGVGVQMTSYSDDTGVGGSFARMMNDMTTDSVPIIILFSAIIAVLAALFFVTKDFVASRALMVVVGSLYAVLGCFAALGFSAMCGIKLNMVHFWCLPFIMVGIGIDDMFMLTLSYKTDQNGADPKTFPKTYANVAVPVTMTSLVNAAMFAILAFCSDIKAVYETGYTGLIATLLLYITMLVSFSALVYMDSVRRAAGRLECLPCVKSSVTGSQAVDTAWVPNLIYHKAFKLSITTVVGRVAIVILSLAIIIPAVVGLASGIDLGIGLSEFAPIDSVIAQWTKHHDEYFGAWPATINWGQIAYTDPNVQMKMAKQFEQVIATEHIVGKPMPTTLVWPAAMALWGDTQTSSPLCKTSWVPNTYGLRLNTDLGVCKLDPQDSTKSLCPVMAGLNDAQLVKCIGNWSREDLKYSAANPNFGIWPVGALEPAAPLRFSWANGAVLFAYKLFGTDKYLKMIEETRRIVDDDSSVYSWMSGFPFDYQEQYLTIIEVMLRTAGLATGVGFAVSFTFLLIELTTAAVGTCLMRSIASFVSSLLISLVSAVSLMCVVGWCALIDIKLSGLTATSCVLSTGLAVEYSVHIIHRFLQAPPGPATQRIDFAMAWLFAPNAMAFTTSAASVLMMAFSKFEFVRLYFFAPLAIAVGVSYFFGAFALPCLLGCLSCMPAFGATEDNPDTSSRTPKSSQESLPKVLGTAQAAFDENDVDVAKAAI